MIDCKLLLSTFLVLTLSNCKHQTNSSPAQPPYPTLVSKSISVEGAQGASALPAFDPAKSVIELSLDNSKSQSSLNTLGSETFLPNCFGPLPDDFVIGEISCAHNEKVSVDLYAGNVNQKCTFSDNQNKAASLEILLSGCEDSIFTIRIFDFNPKIDVHFVKKI